MEIIPTPQKPCGKKQFPFLHILTLLLFLLMFTVSCASVKSGLQKANSLDWVETVKEKTENFFSFSILDPWYLSYGFDYRSEVVQPAAVPILIRALEDEDKQIRIGAANILEELGPKADDAVNGLIRALVDDTDWSSHYRYVKIAVADALGAIGQEAKTAIPALCHTLKDRDFQVRIAALKAIGNIGLPERRPEEKMPGEKAGSFYPAANTPVSAEDIRIKLLTMMNDPNTGVRYEAHQVWENLEMSSLSARMDAAGKTGKMQKQARQSSATQNRGPNKKYDLVLVHGLTNIHPFGDDFLSKCLDIWGEGHVFMIFNNNSTRIWEKKIGERKIVVCGEDRMNAGIDSIEKQAEYLRLGILKLQKTRGLSGNYNIIAQSMGGLVSRYYIFRYPFEVAGLVTLGTPHHGTPLSGLYYFCASYLHAEDAFDHLAPRFLRDFNRVYPPENAPLAENGSIYTIRGDADGFDTFGRVGELLSGWYALRIIYWTDSDGLVPEDSALLEGAEHISDFHTFDHFELVKEPVVALKASEYLR